MIIYKATVYCMRTESRTCNTDAALPGFSLYPPRSPSCTTLAWPLPGSSRALFSCCRARLNICMPFFSRCRSPTMAMLNASAALLLKAGARPVSGPGAETSATLSVFSERHDTRASERRGCTPVHMNASVDRCQSLGDKPDYEEGKHRKPSVS